MKRVLIRMLMTILCAIFLGVIAGRYVYTTYRDDIYSDLNSSRLYLIEKSKYDTYDEMREDNISNNYVYYQDDDGYRTVVGITKNYDNIDKIKKLYNDKLYVKEYYVSADYYNEEQDKYDLELDKIDDDDLYLVKEIVDNILELYRNDDSIRLVSID